MESGNELDGHSQFADPGFVDAARGHYRPGPGSPARRLRPDGGPVGVADPDCQPPTFARTMLRSPFRLIRLAGARLVTVTNDEHHDYLCGRVRGRRPDDLGVES